MISAQLSMIFLAVVTRIDCSECIFNDEICVKRIKEDY